MISHMAFKCEYEKNPLICAVYDFNIYNGNMWVLKKDKAALQNMT